MKDWFDKLEGAGTCGLRVTGPQEATTLEAAWALLPKQGDGWVCRTASVDIYDPGTRTGLLLHAEVADGSRTVVLRCDDGTWRAWTWEETEGTDHRVVREKYLSSAPRKGGQSPVMAVATYWNLRRDGGLDVWCPVGSRFCGWEE